MDKRKFQSAAFAAYASVSWLVVLTAANMVEGGIFRTTLLFAIPVCATAWHSWRVGFVFAAIAVVCAAIGGAMPEPGSPVPLWVDALEAFAKLSVDALCLNVLGRNWRVRTQADAARRRDSPED